MTRRMTIEKKFKEWEVTNWDYSSDALEEEYFVVSYFRKILKETSEVINEAIQSPGSHSDFYIELQLDKVKVAEDMYKTLKIRLQKDLIMREYFQLTDKLLKQDLGYYFIQNTRRHYESIYLAKRISEKN